MNGGHELVFRGEGDLGDDGRILLELFNVHAGHVDGTEDGKFGGVTDLPLAAAVLAQDALGAKDATGQGGLDVGLIGGGTLRLGVGHLLLGLGLTFGIIGMLGGPIVDGMKIGNGKVIGLVLMSALTAATGTVLDDLRDGALELMLGTFGHVGVVEDKVVGGAVGGVDINLVAGVGGDQGGEGHDVLGEGTGLVGADDRDGTESLDGG